jgi:hypothetical protein
MFYRKFAEEGNNLVDNLNKYNVYEDNLWKTRSVLKIFFFQSSYVIILLSSTNKI